MGERGDCVGHHFDPEPHGVPAKRIDQKSGVDASITGSKQSAVGWGKPGPVAANLVGIEPLTVMAVLALPGDPLLQGLDLGFTVCGLEDPTLPQPHIDAGRLAQGNRDLAIELPAGDAQLEEDVVHRYLDLGSQDAGRGAPRFAGLAAPLHQPDPATAQGQLPGARGPDYAPADDHNISICSHLASTKLFETSPVLYIADRQ